MKVISIEEIQKHQGENDFTINSFEAVPLSVIDDIKTYIQNRLNACYDLMNGEYPNMTHDVTLALEKMTITYKECLSFIDEHIKEFLA